MIAQWNAAAGNPEEIECSVLFRATAAETRQVVASLESQPTVAGHSGDHPPDLETLREQPASPHQILIQGNCRGESAQREAVSRTPERSVNVRCA